ncbi:MAG: NAD(P)-dependent oxidoreductase [Brachybacterium sp.]|nr:NAD(P)-dependent oxidoreductase [Brachybacterium sp.]
MSRRWRVAVSGDMASADGSTIYGDIGLGDLTDAGLAWEVVDPVDGRLRGGDLEGFDALLLLGGLPVDEDTLDEVTTLRHIARFGAGYEKVDLEACDRRGITVTNAPTGLRTPMAHTALTLLLALAHNLLAKDRLVREGRWEDKAALHGHGLARATIGVVGLGGIGRETVRMLRGLGLTVVGWNRSPRPEFCAEAGIEQVELDELLRRSDFVVLTVAAAAGTRHLIGARELELLGPGGFLVNIARGSVVDEEALIQALRAERLAGAGLDVFETEPLPADSPLTGMANVVLAPHSLCWTRDFIDATAAEVRECLVAMARGERPATVVNDPDAGDRTID